MEIAYALQHYLFLTSLLAGVVCGIVYDVFRILRAFAFKNKIIIFIEDVIYCLFVSAVFMILFYNYSQGRIRFYAFAGVIMGFSAYYFTVGKLTYKILELIKKAIKHLTFKAKAFIIKSVNKIYNKYFSFFRINRFRRLSRKGFGFQL
ncbi:MAG: hypothetical protein GX148_07615 [Clostridiales bacterium]|jgi:spore cortex biosynthesis protein YabQ|nr:hypothetical protein [Clostridiales bacterium]